MASAVKSEEPSSSDSSAPASGVWNTSQMSVSPKGYPIDILPKGLSIEHILCAICELILKQPVQSMCGHRFCRDCITFAIRQTPGGHIICQACVKEEADEVISIKIDQIHPDTGIKKELRLLQVKCSVINCSFSGKFAEFEEHYKLEHAEVACPFGCNIKASKSVLGQHMKESLVDHLNVLQTRISTLESTLQEGRSSNDSSISENQLKPQEQELKKLNEEWRRLKSRVSEPRGPAAAAAEAPSDNDILQINEQLQILDAVLTVFSREIEKIDTTSEEIKESAKLKKEKLNAVNKRIVSTEQGQSRMQQTVQELSRRITVMETSSYDGSLMWKIDSVTSRRREASSGTMASIYSPIFFTNNAGYRMRARAYLNGDGLGSKTHLSLFFVLMQGTHDAMQKWPFRRKVTITLIEQKNQRLNKQDSFLPDPTSASFQRPTSEMNVASGFPKFISLSDLFSDRNGFVKDDTMFIKVVVDSEDR